MTLYILCFKGLFLAAMLKIDWWWGIGTKSKQAVQLLGYCSEAIREKSGDNGEHGE